ncbi:MAG: PQQ-dependent dehydrogenase, methanol/ethanol family [Acidobacteria bacterium]|nr:PQQ-dependent dehydrogenase, methanol/ethanol family [Acidobacteriota bacterium]
MHAQVTFQDLLQPPAENWLSYSGDLTGRRHSLLKQIATGNVNQLVPQWIFHVPESKRLQATPVVVNGLMYVTDSNQVFALDAGTGRSIWHFKQVEAKQTLGNRGVAVLGDRVFFLTSDAHLVALHAKTGALLWDIQYANSEEDYSATLAPLAIDGKVIVGVGGGDCGIRGFVAAFDASTGQEVWRFWTIPGPDESGSETWGGHPTEISGGATWMTGVYDASQDLVIWTTGNPGPDFFGGERPGDNLYTNCVVALEAKTGKLRWHFQFTPHDTHDWDAQEFPVLVDTDFQGKPRKLLIQANRNGFFYVLDRTNGQMLMAKPFVKKLNWAKGILSNGQPDLVPDMDPSPEGKFVCPGVIGGTNWFSPSYSPETQLFYVMSVEQCDIYTSSSRSYKKGECYSGTGAEAIPSEPGQFILRALDIQTGEIRWEISLIGSGTSSSAMPGTLSTKSGLVFFADDAGYLAAADGRLGKTLWSFYTGQMISASPMSYSVSGKQYVAIATATDVISFGLFDPAVFGAKQPIVERTE